MAGPLIDFNVMYEDLLARSIGFLTAPATVVAAGLKNTIVCFGNW
jgi:hypothetical protein